MKSDKFINYLKNRRVYIVSPHPDDAVLSMGMLLYQLKTSDNVTVINCFTKAHEGPYTFSARKFLKDSGCNNGVILSDERGEEDRSALSRLNVRVISLDLEEALFRRKKHVSLLGKLIPELAHIYPTYRWHIIKSVSAKDYAMKAIKKSLERYKEKDACFFAPYGIGRHADHLITRKGCEDLFTNVILYSEFPYNVRLNNYGQVKKGQQIYRLNLNRDDKNKLIRLYETQFSGLFPNGKIPPHEEVYFFNKLT